MKVENLSPLLQSDTRGDTAAFADLDKDGDPDLYLYGNTGSILLRNDGAGNFIEMTDFDGYPIESEFKGPRQRTKPVC